MKVYERKLRLWQKHLATLPKCPELGSLLSEKEKLDEIVQLNKDVIRSFNNFTNAKSVANLSKRKRYQSVLQTLLESIFVRVPTVNKDSSADSSRLVLSYYQGFNAICAFILLLNKRPKIVFPVIKQMAYNCFLDHLANTFDNTMVWLDLCSELLYAWDDELHSYFKSIDLQFHFALPWIITWFSHSIHCFHSLLYIFSFFIRQHPIIPVYFSVALISSSTIKNDLIEMKDEGLDMPEVFGYLQNLGSRICLFPSSSNEIPLNEVLHGTKIILKKIPVHDLLASRVASKLDDSSLLWRSEYLSHEAGAYNKVIRARERWREVCSSADPLKALSNLEKVRHGLQLIYSSFSKTSCMSIFSIGIISFALMLSTRFGFDLWW